MALGAQVALPVREFDMARGSRAYRGVIFVLSFQIVAPVRNRIPVKLSFVVPVRPIGSPLAVTVHFKGGVASQKLKP